MPSGFETAWRLASCPTKRSPVLEKPTTEGVRRLPSALAITVASPPSITETTEFVVPKSIPITFAMFQFLLISLHANSQFQAASQHYIIA